MTDNVKPIPEGFHTVTPHLVVKGAAKAIEWYGEAFGAEEIGRMATKAYLKPKDGMGTPRTL